MEIIYKNLSGKQRKYFVTHCKKCNKRMEIREDYFPKHTGICIGCQKKNNKNNKIHGRSHTRLYRIWCCMKGRCLNKSNTAYKDYGDRGIRICDEWQKNFMNFYDWAINNGYEDNLSIDRINVNGNYEPSNCRWLTMKTQENNKRNNHYIEYKGKNMTISELSELLNIHPSTLWHRIKNNQQIDKPVRKKEEK